MHWLLPLSIVLASANSIALRGARLKVCSVYSFNLLSSAVWCVCLFIANGLTVTLDADVLLWGAVYGVTQALFILFKALAMNTGSVSVTTLVGNSSLVVSVFACYLFFGEEITAADLAGLFVLMLGIFLTNYKKTKADFKPSWKIFAPLFLFFAAGVGIVFKAFSKAVSSERAGDMMLVSALVMLVSYAVMSLFSGGTRRMAKGGVGSARFLLFALLSGLLACLYNRLNIYLSGVLDGVIFFPSFNGGTVVLSTLLGVFLLGERLGWRQWLGMLVGVIGIVIIGIL